MTEIPRIAAALMAPGRGILALDQPRSHVDEMLLRARVPVTPENRKGLRQLVLTTPGLDRVVSGVLLDAATVSSAARNGVLPALLARRSVPMGVRMGDETVPAATDDLAREIADHAACGASFARWRLVLGDGPTPVEAATATRLVAQWAATCQRGGLAPLVECAVRIPSRHCLDEAERLHSATITATMTALHAAGVDLAALVLGVSLVVPGRRSSQAAAAEDIGRATVRSLRNAGAGAVAGVAFTPTGQPRHLTAHLAAMQWMRPEWASGFCQGRSLLTPVAGVWRGRPDRVRAAQHELIARLTCTSAVLTAGRGEMRRRGGVAWWEVDRAVSDAAG